MCAVFGFLDYGKKVSAKTLKRLLRALSVAAECRGQDATGMSYVKHGKIITFKKAKPANKVKLYFPRGTTAVIGHTRFTTQGSEKQNYNNHPFEGNAGGHAFALAHNGVLYNDQKLRQEQALPDTKIETDSYIAVQLLEQQGVVDERSLQYMAENVEGNFVFTVLRDDNTLFLVKGDNPLVI
ncbi:MAG: class II glutamine amidotransferase [Oscillospiraceae bacterium]|nr:class II glutamine amidotransferase [Oscillospiraceae bacterium]